MAKVKISDYSTTANNNTDINSINIGEGCAPSGINDAIRELMRQLKEFQTGGAGDSVNSGGDFSVATNKFTVASATGNTAVAGTLGATGDFAVNTNKFTVTAASGNTAVAGTLASTGNFAVNTDKFTVTAASGNTSVAGTLGAAGNFAVNTDKFTVAASTGNTAVAGTFAVTGATTLTGALVANGNSTLGDADTDTVTLNASFVNGTTLKTAKTATNTLALAAYDVDGTAYTNLVTLTAGNTPSLALTSTAVGTINNMSIGATTASTGAFTTLSASSDVTLSGGTANGVLYLNGSKVATSGSALVFDGTNLTLGSTSSIGKFSIWSAANGDTLAAFRCSGTGTQRGLYISADNSTGVVSLDATGAAAGIMAFKYGGTEAMRITTSGNLGIGTTSPNTRLTIGGYSSSNQTPDIQITRSSSGTAIQTGPNITFGDGTTNNATTLQVTQGRFGVWNYGGGVWAERMSIDASGNLGLGVTPSAWGSGFRAFEMINGAALWTVSPGGVFLTANAYNNGTNYIYKTSNAASQYFQSSGTHYWYTAPTGTAGNAITFTQAMTLDSSGNLLVGTTSLTGPIVSGGSGVVLRAAGQIYANDTYLNVNADGTIMQFRRSGTAVGSISVTTTATAYNTSSDQRLKENIVDADSASSLIDSLQVRKFDWKEDGSHQRYGFIAQELVSVAPEAVYQPDDSEEMMAVDYSKLVPMLVKEIQSLRKRLADAGIA